MGPTSARHHLHGDDCQPAIWLDAVHRSDRGEVPLGPSGHSGRLHDFHRDRDVGAAYRRIPIDRFGPKAVVCGCGALVAIAWIMNSVADSLIVLYFAAVVAGVGAGPILGGTVGNALKWFPDRRGFAAGLTAAGFGAGSALTIVPIANMIQSRGYEAAYLWFGLGQGIVVMVVALLLRAPRSAEIVAPAPALVQQGKRDYAPAAVLKSPPFWLMYAMFVMVGTSGLMATAQLAPVAKDFAIDTVPVSILGLTMPALSFALSVGLVLNGLSRPFFGWISDHIGRENTMFIAFA